MLFNDLVTWFKEPYSGEVLLKLWKEKRAKDREKAEQQRLAKIEEVTKAEERHRESIKTKAYLLWEAEGKPEGKNDYYWEKAIEEIEFKKIPDLIFIYKFYYWIEKRFLEPSDAWIKKQAFISIFSQLAILAAIVTFIGGEKVRRNNEVFAAWQTITSAYDQSGSGGRIKALEFLNSRPLRFPWIRLTKDWFWDEREKQCKEKLVLGRRWPREALNELDLSAKKAYLVEINLCDAELRDAHLQHADLRRAKLQHADLVGVDLQHADLRRAKLQQAKLSRAKLQHANLWRAKLQQTKLTIANLQQANLSSANLQQAKLTIANLQQAKLWRANLQQAKLWRANLQEADLRSANLQDADLSSANLQDAILVKVENLTSTQIKSACNWQAAIYKGKLNDEKNTFVAIEPDNTNFIEELKQDKSSDPKEPLDCSRWEKEN